MSRDATPGARRPLLLPLMVACALWAAACDDEPSDGTDAIPDAAMADAAPVDAAPVDAAPVDAAPVDAAPVDAEAPAPWAGPVVEIAVRRLGAAQDVDAFAAARDAFVERLRAQPGVGADREFEAVVDFSTFAPPDPPVYIGMTQYASLDAFAAAGEALGGSAEAEAFLPTFTAEAFTALRPLDPDDPVDLAAIAAAPGQVLEVAVRDLSSVPDFSPDAYAAARDAFLDLLRSQPGVVAEYQWVSALDPSVVVGMTVYESLDAFSAVAGGASVAEAPETAAFLGGYPPRVGYVNAVVR